MAFLKQRRSHFSGPRKPLPLWLKLFFILVGITVLAVGANFGIMALSSNVGSGSVQINVPELWGNGQYDEIIKYGKDQLTTHPLESGSLVFSGLSFFQKAVAEEAVEKSLPLIDQAIISLRKALLLPNYSNRPEVFYILGKAYFIKGKYYADLSIKFLKKAIDLNYTASDINEYIGLAYSRLGKYLESVHYFKRTEEQNPSDQISGVLGETYLQLNIYPEAIKYLTDALSKTKDRNKEQQWRFRLGEIYTKLKDYDKAMSEYNQILNINVNSADSHFFIGELFFLQEKKEEARKEWVKAFKIDPLHFGANQRLFNK